MSGHIGDKVPNVSLEHSRDFPRLRGCYTSTTIHRRAEDELQTESLFPNHSGPGHLHSEPRHTQTGPYYPTPVLTSRPERLLARPFGSPLRPSSPHLHPLLGTRSWTHLCTCSACCHPTTQGAQPPTLPRSHHSPDTSTGNHANT